MLYFGRNFDCKGIGIKYIFVNTQLCTMQAKCLFSSLFVLFASACLAQDSLLVNRPVTDSFFLAKKKGIWGKIGRSISTYTIEDTKPIEVKNQFEGFVGKKIRSINVETLSFDVDINDTTQRRRRNFGSRLANALHKNSTKETINKFLLFKEGDIVLPLQLADNERYLREQPFLQDAMIVLYPTKESDKVDVAILTSDVFSIGADLDVNTSRLKARVKEENLFGTGNNFSVGFLWDKNRSPGTAYSAEFLNRNFKGSFINWRAGFTKFAPAYMYGNMEETSYYAEIDKPLVSRYTQFTGGASVNYHQNNHNYLINSDSVFTNLLRYTFVGSDAWVGYNIGAKTGVTTDSYQRLRHFIAGRAFYNAFLKAPVKYDTAYNYNYADVNGLLFSVSAFKQNFFRSNFIYGFGRNEDIPVGLNASAIIGFTNKQGFKRSYLGADFSTTRYLKGGHFSEYIFRMGAYLNKGRFQDVDFVLGFNGFTKIKRLSQVWLNRNFFSTAVTAQFRPFLNTPLFLSSDFGLPYFSNGGNEGDFRTSAKFESVFFNLRKVLGFRFAPFVFTDAAVIRPVAKSFSNSKFYSALGGGFRTRNENLVFGTMEVKFYYFPKTTEGMKSYRFSFGSNIRFRYHSNFIRKPEFIVAN